MTLRIICLFLFIQFSFAIQLRNCPKNRIKFEKVLGVSPPDSERPQLLYHDDDSPITEECLSRCASNTECFSFTIHYNSSSCYWFSNNIENTVNLINIHSDWFVKTCPKYDSCEKWWNFERIPGATLIGHDRKTLDSEVTRTECQEFCVKESEFECRSAKFRLGPRDYRADSETKGRCTLSDVDRHSLANSFRASGFKDEYLENQCAQKNENNKENSFCAYDEFENAVLLHTVELHSNSSKEDCQELCETAEKFNCRGFTISPIARSDDTKYVCYLHTEDSKVFGPKLLGENPGGAYFEKTPCINISITCTETYMTVDYSPNVPFKGRLYMEGYSEQPDCYVVGMGNNTVTLKLPLLSSQCGLIKAKSPDNRTLMTGTMLLQYNPLIQTLGDRSIRIGCIYGNDSKILIGTGITITTAPNRGTPLVNVTNSAGTPSVTMRIIDITNQDEVSSTQIGQDLQLVIEVKPATGLDVWAGHLVAMTEKSDESIVLLDDRGCPTNINVFPALTKTISNETRRLEAEFQAFKFSTSPIVRFSVIVQFCAGTCPEMQCKDERSRREILSRSVETINGTSVLNVNRSVFNHEKTGIQQLPLEYVMIVRNPGANSDRLVLNDGKILVAGYNFSTDEVCLNYSLFIGLIITWVLIQIIFIVCTLCLLRRFRRHYEKELSKQSLEEMNKNFGIGYTNLENRRVHWADNGTPR